MYIETISGKRGNNVFVSFEGTDITQISKITFFYIRFSSSDPNIKSLSRFRIQYLLDDIIWSSRYNITKSERYSDSSTQWTLVSLIFTVINYGIKLI